MKNSLLFLICLFAFLSSSSSQVLAQSAAKEIFAVLDTDGDGRISRDEYMAHQMKLTEVKFNRIDTNSDSWLSEKEVIEAFRALKETLEKRNQMEILEKGMKSYENEEYGFSIQYPAEYAEEKPRANEVFRARAREGLPVLAISVLAMRKGSTVSELKKIFLKALAGSGITSVEFASEKETTLSDGITPAYEFEVEYQFGGYNLRSLNLWVVEHDKWFLVEARTVRAFWLRDRAEMEAIMRTLTTATREYVAEEDAFSSDVLMRDGKSLSPLKAEYENEEYGFSISYPAEYVEEEPRGWGETSEVFRARASDGLPLLTATIDYMDDGSPFTEIRDTYFEIQEQLGTVDVKSTSEKEITLSDGTPAYEIEIEYRSRGYDIKTLNLWVQKYDRWFGVQAITTAVSWPRDLVEIKAILHTFAAPTREPDNVTKYVSFKEDVLMRDGKELTAHIVLPGERGPYAIIFWYTSYGARTYKLILIRSDEDDALFGPDGRADYGFVLVSSRGRYDNKDAAYVGSPTRGEDGADLVEWIGKQSWSSKIGLWGWGADGGAVYDTAAEQPKGLTAIVAQVSPHLSIAPHPEDYTRFYPGGVLQEANMKYIDTQWHGSWDLMVAHPEWGDWWDERFAYKPKAEDINVPVLLDNGWFTNNTNYLFRTYEDLREKSRFGVNTKTVIGPWSQNYPGRLQQGDLQYPKGSRADKRYHRKFFDYWLRGIDNGFYDEPPIYYYQMGEEEWKSTSTWPPPGTKDTKYYLQATGQLLTTVPTGLAEPNQYIFDPKDPSPGIGGKYIWPSNFYPNPVIGPAYQNNKVLADRDDCLIYDTPVLTEDLEIAGNPTIKLFIEGNTPDTDIIIRLCDYDTNAPIDKKTLLMGSVPQRMRYREGLRKTVWMEQGEVYEVDIKMDPIAYTWKAGHRVRIIVSSSAYPLYAINPNNKDHFMWDKGEPLVAEVKLWSNSRYLSYLALPTK
ncbi:MAG: CocE/NonD family hydrolase [Planctomycetota bacterium]